VANVASPPVFWQEATILIHTTLVFVVFIILPPSRHLFSYVNNVSIGVLFTSVNSNPRKSWKYFPFLAPALTGLVYRRKLRTWTKSSVLPM
jgi:hypothetical protein